ncbi:putative clathrin assembly protein [Nymphaea thermarum]|nr:putative clathrin assembly protein [Nymphaea thermarum]
MGFLLRTMLMWALTWVQGWKLLTQWSWKINFAESTSSELQPTEGEVRRSQQILSTSCSSVDHGREPCPVSSEAASQEGTWDYSAWIRVYALFLEEKLECFRVLKYDIETDGPDEVEISSATPKWSCFEFDVFISFRGEETRKGFTSHMFKELECHGVATFIDIVGLKKGEKSAICSST